MALKNCKECKKEVSDKAKVCPHCGVANPGTSTKDILIGLAVLVVIVVIASQACSSDKDKAANLDPAIAQAEKEKAAKAESDCKTDLQCWAEKHLVSASAGCRPLVERLAKHNAKWTDGTFETKLSHYRWKNQKKGTVTYIGDKIQFQNGFGAYTNYIYQCDYDPTTKQIIDVRADPGRLPQ